jgi:uncharacterized integral membrane protein
MNWKAICLLILSAAVLIFIFQNAQVVKISFLLWSFEASRVLVLLCTLMIGITIGSLLTLFLKARKE